MRKFTVLLMAIICFSSISAPRKVVLNDKEYEVDTIMRRQVGPGIIHTRVRVPGYPLNAYVLEMDMTNAYNRVETTQAYNTLGRTELLANAYNRHKEQGKKPIAGCNGSFWCVTGSGEPKNWMLGSPFGGEVVNDTLYLNTNTSADTWNGGPARASSTIIDTDKRVHVGPHQWFGYVKSSKFDADQEIIQVNKRVDTGQLTLFNHAIGRNHTFYTVADCHYVYLKLKPGERWTTASDIKFEVAEVKLNANNQVLGDYDACLVGDGNYKAQLERLAAGDEVIINHYWIALQEDDQSPIKVENMLEGNAWIMLHGEITYRATDEVYNTQTYSKCAYGNNKEGNKLFMLVIDMSSHPEYGRSAGCNTTVMANLFKFLCPELWNLTNNDAGGSAQMMLNGEVINKTTEATPRAVANGMLMFSVAPDEDADVVASLAFDELHIASPTYFSIAPKVLAYNKYGELIADGLEGVTYTCSEAVGEPSADGSKIDVGGETGTGTITAHYGDVQVTAPIEVINSEFAIRIKPTILIDNVRTYPLEVTTELNGEQLVCDARRFVWTVGDANVAQIEDGVLRGISEGTTTITASLDGLSDQTTVTVEVAPSPEIVETFADWTLSSTNLSSDAVLDAEGNVSFGFDGARKANIQLEKDMAFYSLPDHIIFDLETSTRLVYVEMDIRPGNSEVENLVRPMGIMEAGKYQFDLIEHAGDLSDLKNYPIVIKSVRYLLHHLQYNSGSNTIRHKFTAQYDHYTSGIDNTVAATGAIALYPGADGSLMVSAPEAASVQISIFDPAGRTVYAGEVITEGTLTQVATNLPSGLYVVKAQHANAVSTAKMAILR